MYAAPAPSLAPDKNFDATPGIPYISRQLFQKTQKLSDGLGEFFLQLFMILIVLKVNRKSKKTVQVCDIFDNSPMLTIKFGTGAVRSGAGIKN
jgi:hypothetical protein